MLTSSLCRQHQPSSEYFRLSRWSVTPSPTASLLSCRLQADKNDVYLLPQLDEQVATLHLRALGVVLTFLTQEQADCVGSSRALVAAALQTIANSVHNGRVQVQLRARTACLALFNNFGVLVCASCQPGLFGDGVGLTMFRQCAVGSHSSTEQQTTCDWCLEGSTLFLQDEVRQRYSPGNFRRLFL